MQSNSSVKRLVSRAAELWLVVAVWAGTSPAQRECACQWVRGELVLEYVMLLDPVPWLFPPFPLQPQKLGEIGC